MNKCLIDCAIEIMNCERKYGENGDPLIWSSRTRELEFKYSKNDPNLIDGFDFLWKILKVNDIEKVRRSICSMLVYMCINPTSIKTV